MRKWGWSFLLVLQLWIIAALGVAGESESEWILVNAPESYQVQSGDTLWDIANQFLSDPWRWQDVWHKNPNIQDADLIFPGDIIYLRTVGGKPRLELARGHSSPDSQSSGITKLSPRVRSMPAEKAIAAIPLSIIRPFLNESRVITEEQAEHCPEIVALDEDHIVIGAGDLFYVRGLRSHNNQEIFDVFRPNKTYRDPDTQALLGIEGLMLGKAQIQKPGALAQWVVRKSFAEIRVGDKVMETEKETIMPFFMPQYPKGKAQGKIISVFGGISQVSQYQVVVITGGHDQQRQAGDVLGAKQTEKDIPRRLWVDGQSAHGFPPLKIGTLIVFRVFDKVSYALVMNAIRPIYLLDAVGTP